MSNSRDLVAPLSISPPPDVPLTEQKMAGLRQAWPEYRAYPIGEIRSRSVTYSVLNK